MRSTRFPTTETADLRATPRRVPGVYRRSGRAARDSRRARVRGPRTSGARARCAPGCSQAIERSREVFQYASATAEARGPGAAGNAIRGGWPPRPSWRHPGWRLCAGAAGAHRLPRSGAARGPGQNRLGAAAADRRPGAARPRAAAKMQRVNLTTTSSRLADVIRVDLKGRASLRAPSAGHSGVDRAESSLPPTPCLRSRRRQVYQLWILPAAGTPLNAGLLSLDAEGRGLMTGDPGTSDAPKGFAVTAEPAGGSATPTDAHPAGGHTVDPPCDVGSSQVSRSDLSSV